MTEITRADLARLVGVSRPAVSKAVASHHIVVTADGLVDTDLPVNAAWIASHRAGIRQPRPQAASATTAPRAPKRPPAAPPPEDGEADDDGEDGDDLEALLESTAEKTRLTRARRIDTEKASELKDLAIAVKKGELIPRDLERRKWSAFAAALKTNILDLPRRTSARLHAIALAGDAQDLERALEAEFSAALSRVIEAARESGFDPQK